MQRPILATQSDYGTADGRAAALSGNILKIAPEADIYSVLDLYPEGDALNAGCIPLRRALPIRSSGLRIRLISSRKERFMFPWWRIILILRVRWRLKQNAAAI